MLVHIKRKTENGVWLITLAFNSLSQIDDRMKCQGGDVRFAPTLGTLQQVFLKFDPPKITIAIFHQKIKVKMNYK